MAFWDVVRHGNCTRQTCFFTTSRWLLGCFVSAPPGTNWARPSNKSLLNYHCRYISRMTNSLLCSLTVSKKGTNFYSVHWSNAASAGSRKCQLPHRPSSSNTLQAVGCELLVSSLGLVYAENTSTATTSLNVSLNDTCASMSQSSRRLQQHLWAGAATMFSPLTNSPRAVSTAYLS